MDYQIGLTFINKVGPIRGKELLQSGLTPMQIFTEDAHNLSKITGFKKSFFDKMNKNEALDKAKKALKNIAALKVIPIYFEDLNYPRRLKNCPDSPLVIYQKGSFNLNQTKIIAIVGTRKATPYGNEVCREFIKSIADQNITIVSGLANGIDATVHRCCLEFGVPTIGVLGHGLDLVYPSSNQGLATKMLDNGALISEFVPGTNLTAKTSQKEIG